jgi:flagellar hook-associated protein 1 FlgK
VPVIVGSNLGAARQIRVAISDPREIAAASPTGGLGSNANARSLAAIRVTPLLSGGSANPEQFYANLIFRIGRDAKSAVDSLETQNHVLAQIQNQRDSAAGVNLDDEAVSIIRFQKAYQANARFINLIDGLTEEVLRILGG